MIESSNTAIVKPTVFTRHVNGTRLAASWLGAPLQPPGLVVCVLRDSQHDIMNLWRRQCAAAKSAHRKGPLMQDNFDVHQPGNSANDCFAEFHKDQMTSGNKSVAIRRLVFSTIVCCIGSLTGMGFLYFFGCLSLWQSILCIFLSTPPLAVAIWSWHNSRFCKTCGSRAKKQRTAAGLIWCPECHGMFDSTVHLLEPVGRIDITDVHVILRMWTLW